MSFWNTNSSLKIQYAVPPNFVWHLIKSSASACTSVICTFPPDARFPFHFHPFRAEGSAGKCVWLRHRHRKRDFHSRRCVWQRDACCSNQNPHSLATTWSWQINSASRPRPARPASSHPHPSHPPSHPSIHPDSYK